MNERKTYVILGLGRFGSTLAKQLTDYNQDVIAIDIDMAEVDKVSSYVANAVCLDYTDIDALRAAGVEDADVGIVTTATKLDQEILGLVNLKELGVPYVMAKANSLKTAKLLEKVGADETITPELDMAKTCAKKFVSKDILGLFDIDSNHTIFEIKVQPSWIGKSLKELDLRGKYQLNVIGFNSNGNLDMNISPDDKFEENDELLVIGPNDIFKRFDDLNNN